MKNSIRKWEKRAVSFATGNLPPDDNRKKGCQWIFVAKILTTPTSNLNPPMPLDVDSGLPGIELWFGRDASSEVSLLMHLDSCADINTVNLNVHQWLMNTHPYLVTEYIQYDDATPFKPLKLASSAKDDDSVSVIHGKLTAIVCYWLRYKVNSKPIALSFGLGPDAIVNSIVGLPTLRQWGGGYSKL